MSVSLARLDKDKNWTICDPEGVQPGSRQNDCEFYEKAAHRTCCMYFNGEDMDGHCGCCAAQIEALKKL